ncbi:PDDEXK nuclease domain-containing protein [Danxiaibacter flavus]|uniref:PDDEXK nuclease domain-containing protein n=1 Tax=Danxiaibacter flavus TaxID=3049108 RepID=A0ABV3ZFV9_9BACT|nr:PDDEXK nuclease domain-containing protein [Chitinophagaceae bacterium DXS]
MSQSLFDEIKSIIVESRRQTLKSINSVLLSTYWQIGKLIVQDEQNGNARAEYGKAILKNLSVQLTLEFGKGFDERNLNNMRAFYSSFPIWNAVRTELSWTHYRIISRQETSEKRSYYINEAIQGNWNSRTLDRNIQSLYFERNVKQAQKQSLAESFSVNDLIKDPYILEFAGLSGQNLPLEKDLEDAVTTHLQQFLMELGKGFAFVARQQHIVTDSSDYFIDLVFYNYYLKCFVLIDLKRGKLSHQDIGQMDMYRRMYDDLKTTDGDNPTIGLLLCSEKDETIVKYSMLAENRQLFASKYLLYLPEEAELKKLIENDRQLHELKKREQKSG